MQDIQTQRHASAKSKYLPAPRVVPGGDPIILKNGRAVQLREAKIKIEALHLGLGVI